MQDFTETTILKEGVVRVTNLRVIFRTKSYDLSKINVAFVNVREPNLFIPIFFAVNLGICSALIAISDFEEFGYWLQIGLYVGIAAILLFLISRKTKYRVKIRNPVSEITVLETDDRNFANSVVKAVNLAIAKP